MRRAAMDRREMLKALMSLSTVPLLGSVGCGTAADACVTIPEETAGPYPGDGSNGKNALTASGVVRSDIRGSFGSATGNAEGVPLRIQLQLVNSSAMCAPLAGLAIYLWHCDRDGEYSLYTVADENYLRGVQETDADGNVTFTSIFPGCYSGRWPHIHFEVYRNLADTSSYRNKIATSQLALPESACLEAYSADGYDSSARNLGMTTRATDNVFAGDAGSQQLATVSGSKTDGFVASLVVPVEA
ncbi:MAG: intradiol ring-cleavage dioxygenase [Myxococcota bacterium]